MFKLRLQTMALALLLLLYTSDVVDGMLTAPESLTVWRVTRGEWITWRRAESCKHFSMGGKNFAAAEVVTYCRNRLNRLWLPSTAPEHSSQIRAFSRQATVCLAEPLTADEERRLKLKLPICPSNHDTPAVRSITLPRLASRRAPQFPRRIYHLEKAGVLILGDAKANELEKLSQETGKMNLADLRFVVLAQHGRSSGLGSVGLRTLKTKNSRPEETKFRILVSDLSLKAKSRLDPKTRRLLQNSKLNVFETSKWGNIHFDLGLEK